MKAVVIAGIALIASANLARAADAAPPVGAAPVRADQEATVTPGLFNAPPAFSKVKVYDWTGFYLGINGGGAFGDTNWSSIPCAAATPTCATSGTSNISGGLVGGTFGYNLQTGTPFVVSFEGDVDWADIRGTVPAACAQTTAPFTPANCQFKISWLDTARLRFGYAFDGGLPYVISIMPYVTGGAAFANLKAAAAGAPLGWEEANNLGWTAGVGVEIAVTAELRAKVEYLHAQLNGNGLSCDIPCNGGPIAFTASTDIIRAGLNYRLWMN